MADPVTLHDLIEAIASAVIDAQDKIERAQSALIGRYFDADGRPVSVTVRLPSLSLQHPPDEPPEDRVLRVPLLALVGAQLLHIKEVEMSFDVELGEFAPLPEGAAPSAPADGQPDADVTQGTDQWPKMHERRTLLADARSTVTKGGGSNAHVVLKVEASEPSEGVARLLQQLVKFV